jgi:nucleotide-binding universal stress UspA family protein
VDKILVPVDGSEYAEKALFFALDMADNCHANVVILTVVPEIVGEPDWMNEYTVKMRENGDELLTDLLRKARDSKPTLDISKRLAEGSIAPKILEVAEEGSHDIIVMGSRGLGVVKGLLLGSVSSKVVNQAKIPVLIVK